MKIISLQTTTTSSDGYDIDGDITLFFEMTDEQYSQILNTDFDNIWDVLDALLALSESYWNYEAFSQNDELGLSTTAYEHITKTFINFYEI